MRRARTALVTAVAAGAVLGVAGTGSAATTPTPSVVTRDCAGAKGFHVGTSDGVVAPGSPAKVVLWACLDKALPSGTTIQAWGGYAGDGPGRASFSVVLHRAAESSRVYWATWSAPQGAPVGYYQADVAEFRGSTAVADAEAGFKVLRTSAVRLDVGPEPARHGGTVTVKVALTKYYPPAGERLVGYAGQRVRVTFDPTGSAPSRVVRTVTTDASGRASFTASVTTSGVWRVSFAGTPDTYATSTASDAVSVVPLRSVITAAATTTRTSAGASVTVRGTLRHATSYALPTYAATPGKKLKVTFDPAGSGAPRVVGSVTTNASGAFTYRGTVATDGVLTMTFPGSATYSARSTQVAVRRG